MATHRSNIQIVGDILFTARDRMDNEHGVGVTILVRRANIPYTRISVILKTLVSQGLLSRLILMEHAGTRYRILRNRKRISTRICRKKMSALCMKITAIGSLNV